jgi:hypothetical protein
MINYTAARGVGQTAAAKPCRHAGYSSFLVPTLCVGTAGGTLCVPTGRAAERPGVRSHAERGNEDEILHGPLLTTPRRSVMLKSFDGALVVGRFV